MKKLFLAVFVGLIILASCSTRRHARTTNARMNDRNTSVTTSSTTVTTSTSSNAAFAVPATVQSNFTTQYPNVTNVTWTPYDANLVPINWDLTGWTPLTPRDYSVTYNLNGNKYYSWYDANGNWIGTSYLINDYNNGLPAAVNQAISSNFSGYTIDKANKVTWKDQAAYDLKLKNGDNKMKVLIDANGNILKQKDK